MTEKQLTKWYKDVLESAEFWKKGLVSCARDNNMQGALNCKQNLDRIYIKANVIRHILHPFKNDPEFVKVFGDD